MKKKSKSKKLKVVKKKVYLGRRSSKKNKTSKVKKLIKLSKTKKLKKKK